MLEVTKQPNMKAFLKFEFSGFRLGPEEMCEVADLQMSSKSLVKRKPKIKGEEIRS